MRKPRTVKNMKIKEEEDSSNTNESSLRRTRTRRRNRKMEKKVIRKHITVCNKLLNNGSKIEENDDNHSKLIEIQNKIEKLNLEKKRLEDPSFSKFKEIEEKQIRRKFEKKEKSDLLLIANKLKLGLCIEDKKSDMINSILTKKETINIENKLKMKKKKYSFNKFEINDINHK